MKRLYVEALLHFGEWRVKAVKQGNKKQNQTHPAMPRKISKISITKNKKIVLQFSPE